MKTTSKTDLRSSILPVLTALGIVLSTTMAPPATLAQTERQGALPLPDIDDEQLEAFARAIGDMAEISRSFATKMEAVSDTTEQESLRRQQMDEMMSAIESSGLTIDQFNAIHAAARNNSEMQAKINEHAAEAQ